MTQGINDNMTLYPLPLSADLNGGAAPAGCAVAGPDAYSGAHPDLSPADTCSRGSSKNQCDVVSSDYRFVYLGCKVKQPLAVWLLSFAFAFRLGQLQDICGRQGGENALKHLQAAHCQIHFNFDRLMRSAPLLSNQAA